MPETLLQGRNGTLFYVLAQIALRYALVVALAAVLCIPVAQGSWVTWVSHKKKVPWGRISVDKAETSRTPSGLADDIEHMAEVRAVAPYGAADHGVGLPKVEHHRRDYGRACAQDSARGFRRHAATAHQLVVASPIVVVTGVAFGIDDFKILARFQPQAKPFDTVRTRRRQSDGAPARTRTGFAGHGCLRVEREIGQLDRQRKQFGRVERGRARGRHQLSSVACARSRARRSASSSTSARELESTSS